MIAKRRTMEDLLNDTEAVTAAMQSSIDDAIVRRKRLGLSIFVWEDEQVVEIPAEDIPEDLWGRRPAPNGS